MTILSVLICSISYSTVPKVYEQQPVTPISGELSIGRPVGVSKVDDTAPISKNCGLWYSITAEFRWRTDL